MILEEVDGFGVILHRNEKEGNLGKSTPVLSLTVRHFMERVVVGCDTPSASSLSKLMVICLLF